MNGKTWPPAFTKYPSIENHINASRIAAFRCNGKTDICDWIVCEKIHGANLSFTTNGTNLLCSRRTGLLQPEEKFYNFQAIQEKYCDSVMKCWELARNFEMIESDDTITIYGELFGGIYRHSSVSYPVERVFPVQKEVQYCPHTDFLAFDLRCGADDYVDVEVMWSMFDEAGVPYIRPLKTGCSFKEAIAFGPKFHTTMPALMSNVTESHQNQD
ncbi:hypothetical protein BC936DRAFT_147411 [Jimgerdemannia flammicorona]|uniref:RNA ligase domain-containing protein n=1 Tax=Jimgerdemannia flammicorona TaxID=994334 RepID=A0A433D5I3_9FUNG|nr:hypothetical protein BC936DRAFT_147411 [Jimgerdemannia flammicorona]